MEQFNKYFGVQGIMAIVMVGGYVYMSINLITISAQYISLMTLIFGFYFAKNGVGIIAALRGVQPTRRNDDHS